MGQFPACHSVTLSQAAIEYLIQSSVQQTSKEGKETISIPLAQKYVMAIVPSKQVVLAFEVSKNSTALECVRKDLFAGTILIGVQFSDLGAV